MSMFDDVSAVALLYYLPTVRLRCGTSQIGQAQTDPTIKLPPPTIRDRVLV
jgi:hypothetical protein